MASFGFGAAAVAGRSVVASATSKSAGRCRREGTAGLDTWGLQKEDQFYETDPILKKVEEKNGTVGRKSTVSVPASKKKLGGFGGLFAKD